jgi:uncharacterized protein (DUF1684 family)
MSLTLLDWRRRVADLYTEVRIAHDQGADPAATLERFRNGRAELFTTHPESPTAEHGHRPPDDAWPHRPDLRFTALVDTDVEPVTHATEEATFTRVGTVHLPIGDLDVFWLEGYGGGLFLPFKDATNGTSTYGGGRYLLDTAKGADLGSTADTDELVVDFNYAYHPSCAYSPRWTCPLAPPRNTLAVAVEAGERMLQDD